MEDKLISLNDVLERISIIYREKRKMARDLENEYIEIAKRLRSEVNILKYVEFLELQRKCDFIQNEIETQNYIADGIELAREEIFKFMK